MKNTNALTSLATDTNYCSDGCGSIAKVGSYYLPGHDAKLDSMLQRYADGDLAELPALVVANLAKGKGKTMPAARYAMVEVMVLVKVRVAADSGDAKLDASTVLHKRLNVKAVEIAELKTLKSGDIAKIEMARDEAQLAAKDARKEAREAKAKTAKA